MSKKSKTLNCPDGTLYPSVTFYHECLVDLLNLSFVLNVDVTDLIADAVKGYLSSFKCINSRICNAVDYVESKD